MDEKQFLTFVESFLTESGLQPSAFGAEAVNDPNFVFDLRHGRSCSLRMVSRVKDFIGSYGLNGHSKKKGKRT